MYNFDAKPERRNIGSVKWDVEENELPMWVADMDFEAPSFIVDSLVKRANIKTYGYSITPKEYFSAYTHWWEKRHNYHFDEEDMIFSSGVVASLSSICKHIVHDNEKVLLMSPVYNHFYSSIKNQKREVISSDLIYENYEYHIDFDDLEKKLSMDDVTLMILCNPHNPIGKIWTKEELERIGELAYKNGVIVVSDEIHCDFERKGYKYTPFQSVNDINKYNSITCLSTGKTFNLAGLHSSVCVVPNKDLYKKVYRALNDDEVGEPNFFAIYPVIDALENGDVWVSELNNYIDKNREYAYNYIDNNMKKIHYVNANSTYLIWVDVSYYTNDAESLARDIRKKSGLFVTGGNCYGENGKTFLRINLATQLDRVKDGMERLNEALKQIK